MVGRRLCLGTVRQLETWPRWQFALDYAPGVTGIRVVARHLGVILRRAAGVVAALVFYGALLQRAPGGIYIVPVVWAIGAWQMSDTSATPPPRGVVPESAEDAAQRLKKARGATDPNGVMCIYQAPADEEVNAP